MTKRVKLELPVEPAWLSPKQTARLLGVGPQCVRNMINDGKLRALRLNPRLIRIPISEYRKLTQI